MRYHHRVTVRGEDVKVEGTLDVRAYYSIALAVVGKLERGRDHIHLDCSDVVTAFPDGGVPLLVFSEWLREEGIEVTATLPTDSALRTLFINTNWAFHLDRSYYRASIGHRSHLAAHAFHNRDEQKVIVDALLDVLLARLNVTRSVLRALEWAVNEITDNVLNHAESAVGGFVQATAFRDSVLFVVSDAGIGILGSLRSGHPGLRSHREAVSEAVKHGVTRGRQYGRGFGLTGTLSIGALSGGDFKLMSGNAQYVAYEDGSGHIARTVRSVPGDLVMPGTTVITQIRRSSEAKLAEALRLTIPTAADWDYVDVRYAPEGDDLRIILAEELSGTRSRQAGRDIRQKCVNLLAAAPEERLILDFSALDIVPSSFADEVVARLRADLGAEQFRQRVMVGGASPLVDAILRSTLE